MNLSSHVIAKVLNAAHHGPDVVVQSINTDSRVMQSHCLFVALSGDRFDGHQYVAAASGNGAVAALVERAVDADIVQIVVPNARAAMAKLARYWRSLQTARVIGLTGSCGKTTIKEMLASVLREQSETLATKGNLNNDLGVPLTLFQLRAQHRYAVIEMGANHAGEIAYCANIAQPHIALISLIGPAHLEGFGSIEAIAAAKAEIYQSLPANGIAIINADDNFAPLFHQCAGERRVVQFGLHSNADVYASDIKVDASGCALFQLHYGQAVQSVQLTLPGQHNVMNALAAAAAAIVCGLSLAQISMGLGKTSAVSGRLNIINGINGVRLIDDTYNANLASMTAALDVLGAFPGHRIAVLGDMGELGGFAEQQHAQVGVCARERRIDQLFTLGVLSAHTSAAFGSSAKHFTDLNKLLEHIKTNLNSATTILVKGSRSSAMERVVNALRQTTDDTDSHSISSLSQADSNNNNKNKRTH